jgi:hypothetical protein
MEPNAVIGCLVIAGSVGGLVYLVVWSRRTIERIARSNGRSAREISRELRRDR